ncbi:hypothetical protein GCM10020221_14000 [Streptomyces thioluteus]|uniref:Uncharacterized protein n=1 Tax=Streptomyces thioluteus TaxID=66431 RepID=A0ABP6J344_STRTU
MEEGAGAHCSARAWAEWTSKGQTELLGDGADGRVVAFGVNGGESGGRARAREGQGFLDQRAQLGGSGMGTRADTNVERGLDEVLCHGREAGDLVVAGYSSGGFPQPNRP